MTQKRGLGRGLGALIPGAGTSPAPEQELRTRTRPSAGEGGRNGTTRPVDMFFSGEKVAADEAPQRGSESARDLATGMARAAAERRGRNGSRSSAAKGSTTASASEKDSAEAKAPSSSKTASSKSSTAKTSTAKTSTAKSGTAKAGTAKSGTAKTSTAKSTGSTTATKSSASTSAPAKKAAPKSAPAKSAPAKTPASKTAASKTATSRSAAATTTPAKATEATTSATPSPEATSAASEPAEASTPATSTPQQPAGAAAEAPSAPTAAEPAAEEREQSPVVDVEKVESTPVVEAPAPAEESADDSADESTDVSAEEPAEELAETSPAESADSGADHQGLVSVPGAEFAEIPIHEVRENPRNPRTMFDEDELDELAYSLREVGVLQPVVVRPIPVTEDGESFELVMGERRWRAARRAGLTAIPAIIRETSDDDLLRDALLENLHRAQLNPLEEANAYQQLLDDFGCTQDELGERIGRSRPQITNTLRLLRLPALVQRRLASGALSAGHARALLSLNDPALMEELAQRIVSEGLSVRAVERLVARGGQQQTGTRTVRRSTYDPHVVDLTSRLSNRLEAPVRIDVGKRKGRITLEFTNLEDLERLVENMGLDIPLPEQQQTSEH
ncbi:ParB/RepB/Spo0J family partition protein [Brachybacterium aquaticum]|uniref:ParB family chromosome partitioning protein n=1 Tax=Brachybacterium aquaticum TaxID=1432564 RepID=A0A841AIW9_9MICO|nr:ParB/RepB/Spo0J family partition protein [Brachybacterium aquaticum]MBB5832978.1 ParB family chromosome partitioning protein [Brachybacterium aquaticum]